MSETITLTINKTKINFNVDPTDQENLIDQLKANNKVAPMHQFLMRTVDPECKEALKPFLKYPSSVMQIGEKLVEEFSPKINITVGE